LLKALSKENSSASLPVTILLPVFCTPCPTTKAWLLPRTTEAVFQNYSFSSKITIYFNFQAAIKE